MEHSRKYVGLATRKLPPPHQLRQWLHSIDFPSFMQHVPLCAPWAGAEPAGACAEDRHQTRKLSQEKCWESKAEGAVEVYDQGA